MNPFTESTVARPLTESEASCRLSRQSVFGASQACLAQSQASARDYHPGTGGTQVRGRAAAEKQNHPKTPRRFRLRPQSLMAAVGLGVSATLSLASGALCNPAFVAGTLAAVSMLAPHQAQALNLNTATALELQSLKGVGPKMATLIIEERQRGGDFESLSDFTDRIKGIGPKKAAALQAAGLEVTSGKPGKAGQPSAAIPPSKRATAPARR